MHRKRNRQKRFCKEKCIGKADTHKKTTAKHIHLKHTAASAATLAGHSPTPLQIYRHRHRKLHNSDHQPSSVWALQYHLPGLCNTKEFIGVWCIWPTTKCATFTLSASGGGDLWVGTNRACVCLCVFGLPSSARQPGYPRYVRKACARPVGWTL